MQKVINTGVRLKSELNISKQRNNSIDSVSSDGLFPSSGGKSFPNRGSQPFLVCGPMPSPSISRGPMSVDKQESSAKLTNQRVSYAFTSSPLSFHARHILPTSKFQHSYCCILLIFLQTSMTVNGMCENCECEYSSLV